MTERDSIRFVKAQINRFLANRRLRTLFTTNLLNHYNGINRPRKYNNINDYIIDLLENSDLKGFMTSAFDWSNCNRKLIWGNKTTFIDWLDISFEYDKFYNDVLKDVIDEYYQEKIRQNYL